MREEIVSGYYKSVGDRSFSIAGVVEMSDGASLSIAIVSENLAQLEHNHEFAESAVHAVIAFIQNSSEKEYAKLLFYAVSYANKVIYEKFGEKGAKGNLAIAIIPENERAYVANVGNSRIYLARRSKLTQLSLDHTVFNLLPIQEKMNLREEKIEMANDLFVSIGSQPVIPVDVGLHFPEVSCKEEYIEAQERGKAGLELMPGDSIVVSSRGFQSKQSKNGEMAFQAEMTASLLNHFGDAAAERISHLDLNRGVNMNPAIAVLQFPLPAKREYLPAVRKIIQRYSGVFVGALMTLLIFLSLTISSIIVMAWGQSNDEWISQVLPLSTGEPLFDNGEQREQTGANGAILAEGGRFNNERVEAREPAIVHEEHRAGLPAGHSQANRGAPFFPKTAVVKMTIEEIFPNFGLEENSSLTVTSASPDDDRAFNSAAVELSNRDEADASPELRSQPQPVLERSEMAATRENGAVGGSSAEREVLVRLNIRTGPTIEAEISGLLLPGEPFLPYYKYRAENGDVWLFGQALNSNLVGWVWAPGTAGGKIEEIPTFLPSAIPLK